MHPLFSVILPIYNVETYLDRCLQSILLQEFFDYEIILVDDGSTDGSGRICDNYAERYDHIKVVHKKNGGLSSARNAGIELAKGEYIWWIDSDDWVEKQSLSVLYDTIRENRPDIVKFNHVRVTDREVSAISSAAAGRYIQRSEIDVLLRQAFSETSRFVLSAWSHLYRREFLLKEGLRFVSEREIGSEDYLFNLQALLVASHIIVLKDELYCYELRPGSLSQRYKEGAPQKYTTLYLQLRKFYEHHNALHVYERVINTFYVWHLIHGICISNEYMLSETHSLAEGRKNVISLLSMPYFKEAACKIHITSFSWKQKIQLQAMKYRLEPLFYWLYVTKHKNDKGKI